MADRGHVESLRPRDEADVAEILSDGTQPFELLAGGSKRGVGRPLDAAVLDLAALNGIIDYEPEELVLTARPATPLALIESLLLAHGQQLAFEPPDLQQLLGIRAGATLGGVLAANLSGPRRVSAGAARDHFLGFRAVSGRGERFKGGGRVVKNVTGYDLPKVLAGSWGTLAVLTEVTVRVHPAGEEERTLLLALSEVPDAVQVCAQALASGLDVSGAAFVPGRGVGLRLAGFAPSVQARAHALLALLGSAAHDWLLDEASRGFWREVGSVAPLVEAPVVWRLGIPPADAAQVLERLCPERFLLDWGGGLVWLGSQAVEAERVRGALPSGHATLIKAPSAVRAMTAVFQPQPAAAAALCAQLKRAFDPGARLNPGRMD
jgi:glycolate oxidase FAD binding subunit